MYLMALKPEVRISRGCRNVVSPVANTNIVYLVGNTKMLSTDLENWY